VTLLVSGLSSVVDNHGATFREIFRHRVTDGFKLPHESCKPFIVLIMPGIDVSTTLGPILISQFLSTMVFGITILQTYLYFTKYATNDRPTLKAPVAVTWLFDMVHVVIGYHVTYFYLITAFGKVELLMKSTWSIQGIALAGSPPVFFVQTFFAHRIYMFSKNVWIPSLIVAMSTGQVLGAILWTQKASQQSTVSGVLEVTNTAGIVCCGFDIAANAIITIAMVYYLRQQSSSFTKQVLPLILAGT
jgi:hypothetical protein